MRTTIEPNLQIRIYGFDDRKIMLCEHIKIKGHFSSDTIEEYEPEYLQELEIFCTECKKDFKFDIRVN